MTVSDSSITMLKVRACVDNRGTFYQLIIKPIEPNFRIMDILTLSVPLLVSTTYRALAPLDSYALYHNLAQTMADLSDPPLEYLIPLSHADIILQTPSLRDYAITVHPTYSRPPRDEERGRAIGALVEHYYLFVHRQITTSDYHKYKILEGIARVNALYLRLLEQYPPSDPTFPVYGHNSMLLQLEQTIGIEQALVRLRQPQINDQPTTHPTPA